MAKSKPAPVRAPVTAPATAPSDGALYYLYGITAAADASRVTADGSPGGIDGAPVAPLVEGPVAGIVGRVSAVEFDEAPLNAHLADMGWLAPRAEAHQRVNAIVAERTEASLPLSFGTIFRTEESLRQTLRAQARELLARLDAVRGCSEWVVTVRRDTARAEIAVDAHDASLAKAHADLAASTPGRRFLLERQLADLRRRALLAADAAIAKDVAEAAQRSARLTHAEPLAAPNDAARPVISRLSALVERAGESQFWDALDAAGARWHERGYEVERSGPWPVYRFSGALAVGAHG